MLDLQLTANHERALRDTTIDAEHPGAILHDFDVVLQYVQTEEVKACGKYNLMPIAAIPVLDERLHTPLRLPLKRPQLKSHPYLQGLHLLLRATGLGMVEGVGDKARLRLDPVVHEQWLQLNATERFFTLIEAAFLHSNGAMIGESSRGFDVPFFDLLGAWKDSLNKGQHANHPPLALVCQLYRKSYLLALADLFGLMRVEQLASARVPWTPRGVYHAPFGDAFFTLMGELDFDDLICHEQPADFGAWQPIWQPYFPEWRANLVQPEPEMREGVFVFKVALDKVWRQIAIPESLTLDDLAGAILAAFKFDDDHLYEFSFRDRLGKTARIIHPEANEGPFTDEYPIGGLPLQPGQSMRFLFDFGDNWKFNVKLERIDPHDPDMRSPSVLAKHGTPPEQYPNEW